ncbi:putative metallo-hydrolase YybB [Paenibacillus sp. J31TS4]|uniref:MBL fold metallo-hydrolase n=1 Tax=Paenibacillus sp. J31TS4 TaxID=2807195 RepID=UPI001B11BB9F|nr:MBL fold metallo-hydrolase [Paenibacillus sp. J31TS4]GIP40621.1 putative metallo-hydrolase YybB [Paenibacillus sp. J31TS4]
MRVEQLSPHIWSCKSWMLFTIQVWLVKEEDGLVLVDAGMKGMVRGIEGAIAAIGLPLRRILLTHGHSDHVGSAETLAHKYGVPVYLHANDIPYAEGQQPFPGRKRAERLLPQGLVQPLADDGGEGLAPVGSLRPYWTPGHSPGHTAYYHETDRVLLGGDLFTTKQGRLNRPMPMFTADMPRAVRSAGILRELNPALLAVCHSPALAEPAVQLDTYLAKWQ